MKDYYLIRTKNNGPWITVKHLYRKDFEYELYLNSMIYDVFSMYTNNTVKNEVRQLYGYIYHIMKANKADIMRDIFDEFKTQFVTDKTVIKEVFYNFVIVISPDGGMRSVNLDYTVDKLRHSFKRHKSPVYNDLANIMAEHNVPVVGMLKTRHWSKTNFELLYRGYEYNELNLYQIYGFGYGRRYA